MRGAHRLTDVQIVDVYTSSETDREIANRLNVSQTLIVAIRTKREHASVTAALPDRPRGRAVDRPRAEIVAQRAVQMERRASLDRRRELILTSREPHSKIAQQLGIDRSAVFRIRRAAGWVADPKPVTMVPKVAKSKSIPKPRIAKPKIAPKPKPLKAEPGIVEWIPAFAAPKPAPKSEPVPPPPDVIDVRAELKRFLADHPLLSALAFSRHLDLRLPWLSIINAMALPDSSPGPRGPKQVRPAVRLKPGYLRARDPRAVVCRFYSVTDRPEPRGLGEPL